MRRGSGEGGRKGAIARHLFGISKENTIPSDVTGTGHAAPLPNPEKRGSADTVLKASVSERYKDRDGNWKSSQSWRC